MDVRRRRSGCKNTFREVVLRRDMDISVNVLQDNTVLAGLQDSASETGRHSELVFIVGEQLHEHQKAEDNTIRWNRE